MNKLPIPRAGKSLTSQELAIGTREQWGVDRNVWALERIHDHLINIRHLCISLPNHREGIVCTQAGHIPFSMTGFSRFISAVKVHSTSVHTRQVNWELVFVLPGKVNTIYQNYIEGPGSESYFDTTIWSRGICLALLRDVPGIAEKFRLISAFFPSRRVLTAAERKMHRTADENVFLNALANIPLMALMFPRHQDVGTIVEKLRRLGKRCVERLSEADAEPCAVCLGE